MNDDIEAIIARNEERKRIKKDLPPGPYHVQFDSDHDEDGSNYVRWPHALIYPGLDGTPDYLVNFSESGTPDEIALVIEAQCNDRPEDDIDQLLALIADLQSALQER